MESNKDIIEKIEKERENADQLKELLEKQEKNLDITKEEKNKLQMQVDAFELCCEIQAQNQNDFAETGSVTGWCTPRRFAEAGDSCWSTEINCDDKPVHTQDFWQLFLLVGRRKW